MSLYTHVPHRRAPVNVNALHRAEQAAAGANTRIAVWLTQHVGSMLCAYIFAGIGVGSLVGVFTGNSFLALLFGSISSYFLQLVLLPVLAVGQAVLGRKAELQADEAFVTTQRSYADLEQIAQHLAAQDAELVKQTATLAQIAVFLGAPGAAQSSEEASK